ncbi:hypothetical protein B0T19DRAFT_482682 [Cercophora scortea]|uniref:Uncharacterized protein n=1 Tax=Cercophora scortea TaxID=314031 RepID=A0AAE0IW94_9PEZI|nr:hypothetical protein B0T19DRAFT_482682 [Cercophora scortea]
MATSVADRAKAKSRNMFRSFFNRIKASLAKRRRRHIPSTTNKSSEQSQYSIPASKELPTPEITPIPDLDTIQPQLAKQAPPTAKTAPTAECTPVTSDAEAEAEATTKGQQVQQQRPTQTPDPIPIELDRQHPAEELESTDTIAPLSFQDYDQNPHRRTFYPSTNPNIPRPTSSMEATVFTRPPAPRHRRNRQGRSASPIRDRDQPVLGGEYMYYTDSDYYLGTDALLSRTTLDDYPWDLETEEELAAADVWDELDEMDEIEDRIRSGTADMQTLITAWEWGLLDQEAAMDSPSEGVVTSAMKTMVYAAEAA